MHSISEVALSEDISNSLKGYVLLLKEVLTKMISLKNGAVANLMELGCEDTMQGIVDSCISGMSCNFAKSYKKDGIKFLNVQYRKKLLKRRYLDSLLDNTFRYIGIESDIVLQ